MKLVSFNLRSANDPNGHSFNERAPRMKALIEKYDPDLIGFQETVPGWMEHIPEDYGDTYEIFHKYRNKDKYFDIEGCTILWKKGKYECLDQGCFWYSDTPGVPSRGWCSWGHYRFCLWVKLREVETGKEFHYFDTHYGFSDKCQIDSTRLIRDHIKALDARAAIVSGDFNMTQNSPAYRDMVQFMVDVNKATVNDISITCHGYNLEHTGIPIDFCFVTPNTVKPITYKKMDETFDGKFPSDHYGVYAELEICQAVKVMSMDMDGKTPENDQSDRGRVSQLRMEIIRELLPDLIGLQHMTPYMNEGAAKLGGYEKALLETATPIFCKKYIYTIEEAEAFALPSGEAAGYAVIKHLPTDKKLCMINAMPQTEADAKAICEKAASFGDLPVVCTVDAETVIGTPGYKALCAEFKDVRAEVAPRDYLPTYRGDAENAPALKDYILVRNADTNTYENKDLVERFARDRSLSTHNAVLAGIVLK